ncbi:hypothetical protein HK102_010193 [Quaeritorhiza haematococci]|nr:hypothetical protein HK102_010193 [Quaeritorhiza haematococci]
MSVKPEPDKPKDIDVIPSNLLPTLHVCTSCRPVNPEEIARLAEAAEQFRAHYKAEKRKKRIRLLKRVGMIAGPIAVSQGTDFVFREWEEIQGEIQGEIERAGDIPPGPMCGKPFVHCLIAAKLVETRKMATYQPVTNSDAKIQQVHGQIQEVIDVAQDGVNKLIDRGEKISVLQGHAEEMEEAGKRFKKQAKDVKRKFWWQNLKMTLLLGGVVFVIVLIVVLVVLSQTGVLNGGGGGGSQSSNQRADQSVLGQAVSSPSKPLLIRPESSHD